MLKDTFHDRGHADETAYFQQRDARLLEKLRERARLAEIAHALAGKLQVDEPELLERIKALGVTLNTGAAFILAPLVDIAWADGRVAEAEHDAVLRVAERRGVAPGSPDHQQLLAWLAHRPSDAVLQAALEAIRIGISVLPPDEARQRVAAMVKTAEEVAQAKGAVATLLRPHGISPEARAKIAAIQSHLERRGDGDGKRSGG